MTHVYCFAAAFLLLGSTALSFSKKEHLSKDAILFALWAIVFMLLAIYNK